MDFPLCNSIRFRANGENYQCEHRLHIQRNLFSSHSANVTWHVSNPVSAAKVQEPQPETNQKHRAKSIGADRLNVAIRYSG